MHNSFIHELNVRTFPHFGNELTNKNEKNWIKNSDWLIDVRLLYVYRLAFISSIIRKLDEWQLYNTHWVNFNQPHPFYLTFCSQYFE